MVITIEDDDTPVTTPAPTPIQQQAPDTIPITAVDVEEDTLACNNAHLGSVLYVYLFL